MGIHLLETNVVRSLTEYCDQIAITAPDNVQETARLMQKMIVSYYQDVRRQALLAFFAAFVLEVVAVAFFVYAAYMTMGGTIQTAALSAISGFLIQLMTAVVFYLYSQSARQFAGFHICLERTNRYLLANALVEHLPDAERATKRAELISVVLNAPTLTLSMIEKGS